MRKKINYGKLVSKLKSVKDQITFLQEHAEHNQAGMIQVPEKLNDFSDEEREISLKRSISLKFL